MMWWPCLQIKGHECWSASGDVGSEPAGVIHELWESFGDGVWKTKLLVRDTIADITLQQVPVREGDRTSEKCGGEII